MWILFRISILTLDRKEKWHQMDVDFQSLRLTILKIIPRDVFCLQENFKFEIEQYVAAEWVYINSAVFVYISIKRIQGVASLVTNTMFLFILFLEKTNRINLRWSLSPCLDAAYAKAASRIIMKKIPFFEDSKQSKKKLLNP